MTALLCAVLGGIASYLAFGLDDVWWLAWFAAAPTLWLAYGEARDWVVFTVAFFATAMGMIYFYQAYGTMMLFGGTALLVSNALAGALTMLFVRRAFRRFVPHGGLVGISHALDCFRIHRRLGLSPRRLGSMGLYSSRLARRYSACGDHGCLRDYVPDLPIC
jgi:apolipoprotein N-acyltransferase